MTKYVVGMDGGGTKTAVVIADEQGRPVHSFTAGAMNYNGQEEERVRKHLHDMIDTIADVCGGLDRCVQMCVGAAGVSNPTVRTRLERTIRDGGYAGDLLILGDQETALAGAHGHPHGMILIAGTGSICYGKDAAGMVHRAGGYGHLIDDEGSGYSIGRDLIASVVRASDGRGPETAISCMVYAQLGMSSIGEIVSFVYDARTSKKDIAALAPLLAEACMLGDETALGIAQRSAAALCELVAPVAEKLSMQEGALAMAGSVLLKNAFVQTALVALVQAKYPKLRCITPRQDAACGAVLLALEQLKRIG